jgi:predicted homoserine dehydrogenase-like protein
VTKTVRVGIVGTGFIARGAAEVINKNPGMAVSRVLTRRPLVGIDGFDREVLTQSAAELADESDVIVEASGDAIHATAVLDEIARASLPIITMDSELQVTTGSYFANRTYLTESDGDQPGCLARLKIEAEQMGFTPLALVNIKGYLNHNPTREDMAYWAAKQGLSLDSVVSFTDGTKLQIEQVLVANGLDADMVRDGFVGGEVEDLMDTDYLADLARERGRPISDFVVCRKAPPGVFLLGEHPQMRRLPEYGPFAKLMTSQGVGMLLRSYHLCHLEIPRTIEHVIHDRPPLLNNSTRPRAGVGAVPKVVLKPGQVIERALGSFEARGVGLSIEDHPDHVPICLLADAVMRREVGPDRPILFEDVDLPESRALEIYLEIREEALGREASPLVTEPQAP